MARIGVMGGTFNPPHIGHLICASEACDQLGLDKVLFVPVHTPPHKEIGPGAPSPQQRAELCRAAVEGDSRFEVSMVEIERGGPSYSVDTLGQLSADHAGDELVFIIGADTALSLPTWHKPEEVVKLATFGVAGRQGVLRRDVVDRLAGLDARVAFFSMPRVDISSSEIRRRLAGGHTVDYLLPAAVAKQVRAHSFYTPQVPA